VSKATAERWVAEPGGMIPDLAEPSGRYPSLAEREEIAEGRAAGPSKAEIARRPGRHRFTIGREPERNRIVRHPKRPPLPDGQPRPPGPRPGTNRGQDRPRHERVRYRPPLARAKAEQRARRPKPRKPAGNPALTARAQAGPTKRWSPQQIARTPRRDFPERPEMWGWHQTIYQQPSVQGRGRLRRELTRCRRTGRALRRPRGLPDRRRERRIRDKVMISQRPAQVEDRAVPGHREGDLIIGKGSGSAIDTLVERSTRFVMLLRLPGDHGAEQVRDAMLATMRTPPVALRRSLTRDRGIEPARHAEITFALDLPSYFCDPHGPWQRGGNEDTNGLLRRYFPKGTGLSIHATGDLDPVAAELNERPRKTLGWDAPAEVLARLLSRPVTAGVATTR
jgi:IS30 family transposase